MPPPVVPPAGSIAASSILTEGYVGLESQALGLAEAAGLSPAIVRITPRRLHGRFPARWWPRPEHAVEGLADLQHGLIVSAGGTAGAVAAALRRTRGLPVVHVQHPRMRLDRFDLVVVNRHDRITGPNVIVTRTALHRATPERLAAARAEWRPRLDRWLGGIGDRRLVAVLLGGSNGRYRLDPPAARRLGSQLAAAAIPLGAAIVATPSRRTEPETVAIIRGAIAPVGGVVWDGSGDNPYFGMLACADSIVATEDSVSMISEAAATEAPVHVATLPGSSARIRRFLALLQAERRIRLFERDLEPWPVSPIDDTGAAADEMRRRLRL